MSYQCQFLTTDFYHYSSIIGVRLRRVRLRRVTMYNLRTSASLACHEISPPLNSGNSPPQNEQIQELQEQAEEP